MNPLDQLADITLPNTVSMWPLAWGYWLALVLILAIIASCIIALVQFRNKRKVKREALLALTKLDIADEYYAHKVQVIMKSVCSHYLTWHSSSQMYGKQWQSFVLSVYQGKDSERLTQALDHVYQGLYFPNVILEQSASNKNKQIQVTIKEWIETSFPCKKAKKSQFEHARVDSVRIGEVHNV